MHHLQQQSEVQPQAFAHAGQKLRHAVHAAQTLDAVRLQAPLALRLGCDDGCRVSLPVLSFILSGSVSLQAWWTEQQCLQGRTAP